MSQSWGKGRPGVGRVMMVGLFASALRPKGFLTVTYKRINQTSVLSHTSTPDPIDQIRRLGELRDAGLITTGEFESKKADLLSRL